MDRKINKITEEIQSHKNKMRSVRLTSLMYIKGIYSIIIILISVNLIWKNLDKPLINFSSLKSVNQDLNIFFPLNYFLSFPYNSLANSFGVTFWLFILNRIFDVISNKISYNNTDIKNNLLK